MFRAPDRHSGIVLAMVLAMLLYAACTVRPAWILLELMRLKKQVQVDVVGIEPLRSIVYVMSMS